MIFFIFHNILNNSLEISKTRKTEIYLFILIILKPPNGKTSFCHEVKKYASLPLLQRIGNKLKKTVY